MAFVKAKHHASCIMTEWSTMIVWKQDEEVKGDTREREDR